MPELQGQLGCHGEEGIVIESLFIIVGRRKVLSQQLVQLFQIFNYGNAYLTCPGLQRSCALGIYCEPTDGL